MRLLALLRGGGGRGGGCYCVGRTRGGDGSGGPGGGRYNILPGPRRSSPGSPTNSCLLLYRSLRTRSLKQTGESSAVVLPRLTHSPSSSFHYSTVSTVSKTPLEPSYTGLVRSSNKRPFPYTLAKLASSQQQRDHGGHSHGHGHHHHHDNTYLTSKNKADAGVRITRLGLYTNVGMAISKGIGGWYFNSQALIADAFHSLTDLISDVMTLATVSFALKKPTDRFPNGYGKIESMGSLGVSSLLLVGGLLMGYHALDALYAEFFLDHAEALAHAAHSHGHGHGHSHSHSHTDLGPNVNAAWLAAGSIVIKEWLYRATMKVAKERKSSVLASNAVHHRIDSLTAIVALCAIGGAHFLNNASWLDPVGGLLVSIMVVTAGWGNTRAALMELVDVGLDDEMKDSIRKAATKALALLPERLGVRSVGGLKSGQNYLAELTIEVPSGMTVAQTSKVEEELREVVGAEVRGVRRIKVRFVEEGLVEQTEFVEKEQALELEDKHEHHDHDHEPKKGL